MAREHTEDNILGKTAANSAKAGKRVASGESGKIQSLMRAAAILEAVARHPEGISLADLSAAVDLRNSTAFHLIQTLVNLGFLNQLADNRRYRIGTRLFSLAAGAMDENTLLSLGTPILERLSAETGDAAHLAVRSRQDVIVLARMAASGLLQLAGHPGATRPVHATAIGKMLLSAMPLEELDRLLETLPLRQFTQNTITDPARLRDALEEIRKNGIAHDRCELDNDVRCVAAPVYDFSGRCIAAMGISGPVWRMSDQALKKKIRKLKEAAEALSSQLGLDKSKRSA
jgi:IclR family acetate operon transcriptional repressor